MSLSECIAGSAGGNEPVLEKGRSGLSTALIVDQPTWDLYTFDGTVC